MKKVFLLLSMALLAVACSPKAEPIDYGKEECAFCKMTIVSPQFASEVVTQKSKAFKYDAIECMLQAPQEDKIALHLVCDYLHENTLIDATKATYLISKEIQSPMGAHLAAFASKDEAQKVQAEKGGDLYDWAGIQAKFQSHQHPAHDHGNMHDH
jgi:nitrous-oxide reductase accessory protein nosL|nr:nitrous oxide reductase accessory protein NosL [uncultured Capnocytophaga sp.]